MKGSRLPFALYLLSGTTGCSLAPFSPSSLPETPLPAAAETVGGLFGTSATGSAALPPTANARIRLPPPLCFTPAGFTPACESDEAEEDFTGATTATPLDFSGARAGLAAAGVDCWMPSAPFEAALALLFTPVIVLRVFWIMLGL
jgi:hypothetical protein